MNQKLEGQIRHILSLVGGFLVALGVLDTEVIDAGLDVVMTLVGGVFALIAFVRSYVSKQSNEDAEKIATAVAAKLQK